MSIKLSHTEIRNWLPHRYPFLLIDQVIELIPGKEGMAIKNVTANEPYFQGHFPEELILPGVLIVEACGQLAGLVKAYNPEINNSRKAIEYLASIQKFNFKNKVYPGDQLILKVFNFIKVNKLLQVDVRASVKTKIIAEGSLVLTAINE